MTFAASRPTSIVPVVSIVTCSMIGTSRPAARSALRATNAGLRATYDATIEGWSRALDLRDKETEGHSRRVTQLTLELARELGLGEAQLVQIRRGALLHDIGKIAIPGELLTRPGRLSDIETAMVRTHVQAGYHILQGIDFPWPVAEIVYHHHERLDGSGYPRGLKDKQIIEEARIVAVADTVEAMVSHRPYRSSQGLEAALTQIRADAGTKLDAAVVAACCRLFEGGKFCLG